MTGICIALHCIHIDCIAWQPFSCSWVGVTHAPIDQTAAQCRPEDGEGTEGLHGDLECPAMARRIRVLAWMRILKCVEYKSQ